MQPIKVLSQWLLEHADQQHYLFAAQDFRQLFQGLSDATFKTLLSRAVALKVLERVCRGVYLYRSAMPSDGLLLFHVAALLRADNFNYISLETALSDMGVISQIPINWITLMSSGRANRISCGAFGVIEFIHTHKQANELVEQLSYDPLCGMWRANLMLAIKDMKAAKRNCDLIDWDKVNEFI